MKTKMNIMKYVMAIICMAVTAACSDSDGWQAGPQVKEGCQQVHFATDNESVTMLDPDNRTVTLNVVRNTTEGALTVPMSVEKQSDGLDIPTEVQFADGQQVAAVAITLTGEIVQGTSYSYALRLTGDEVDPYTTEGSSTFEGTISIPNERRAKMWITGAEDVLGYWNATVLDLGGGIYRIKDLMGSGLELNITLDANNMITMDSPQWHVDGIDYKEEDNSYPGCYYYYCNLWNYNTQSYEYYPFYPHGKEAYVWIEKVVMYSGDGYAAYNKDNADPKNDYFYIHMQTLKLNTEKNDRYWSNNLCFRFLEDGETLEDYLPEQPEEPDTPENPNAPYEPGTYNVNMWFEGAEGTIGNSWNETMTVNEDGTCSFADLMNSGMDLTITLDENYRMTLTSSLLAEEYGNVFPNYWYPTDCYYYCNQYNYTTGKYDYWPFYPYGKDAGTYVEYITMYTDSNTNNWYSYYWADPNNASDSYFSITLGYLKLSNESDAREWAKLCFKVVNE